MDFPQGIPMPDRLTKQEILDILIREEYGKLPPEPTEITAREVSCDNSFCRGMAQLKSVILDIKMGEKEFSFPVKYVKSKSDEVRPCIILINFRPDVPDRYLPAEEIFDSGHNILSFCYNDITNDRPDFSDGLSGILYPFGNRPEDAPGKISMWCWAALRVMDYAMTLDDIDKAHITVAGHSRLGKTALLAGAMDERFFCAYSNDSGCSGAAISREKTGERIEDICRMFSYWFKDSYKQYINNEDSLPFDQHFLLCANLPHRVYVASAEGDWWADPESEYKSCLLAESYFKNNGYESCLKPQMPSAGEYQHDGYIGHHIRRDGHYLSRDDWNIFLKYLKKHY